LAEVDEAVPRSRGQPRPGITTGAAFDLPQRALITGQVNKSGGTGGPLAPAMRVLFRRPPTRTTHAISTARLLPPLTVPVRVLAELAPIRQEPGDSTILIKARAGLVVPVRTTSTHVTGSVCYWR
jgi:hypothetical protein